MPTASRCASLGTTFVVGSPSCSRSSSHVGIPEDTVVVGTLDTRSTAEVVSGAGVGSAPFSVTSSPMDSMARYRRTSGGDDGARKIALPTLSDGIRTPMKWNQVEIMNRSSGLKNAA